MDSIKQRFYDKVMMIPFHSCWEWIGSLNRTGYGQVSIDNKTLYTHRASYKIHKGPIPKGKMVLHSCDNPSCVNPDHLFLGTQADNMADMANKGRALNGSKHPMSKLSEDQVSQIRELKGVGLTQKKIADMFGISHQQVSKIQRNERW